MDPQNNGGGIAWKAILDALMLSALVGGLGRAARWARKERLGPRRWSLWLLLWEAVLAVFCGFLGSGLAEAMNLGPKAEAACIGLLAYFGPEFIEDLVLRFRDRELPPPPPPPAAPA